MTRSQISVSRQQRSNVIAATVLLDPPIARRSTPVSPALRTVLRHLRRPDTNVPPAVSDIVAPRDWGLH